MVNKFVLQGISLYNCIVIGNNMATKGNKTDTILIRVAPELKKKLQAMADKDSRKLSDYIRLQLEAITSKK